MLGMVVRGLIIASIGSLLLSSSVVAASDNLWHKDQEFTVTTSDSVEYPTKQYWMAGCSLTWSPVMQKEGTTKREKICAFRGKNLSMGRYVDSSNQAYYVIKISSDSVYRQIAGISGYSGRVYLRPDDDTLIVQFPGAQSPNYPRFWQYSLSNNAFLPEMSDTGFSVWRYSLNSSARLALMGFETPSGSMQYPTMDGYAFSRNRQFVLAWLKDDSLIVANTKTGETRSIAVSLMSGVIDSAISDDGKYAVLGTVNQLYYTENCGRPYDYDTFKLGHSQFRYSSATECERTYLHDQIDKAHTFGSQGAIFYFSDDNTTLSFDYPRETPKFHRVIQTEAYHPEQLDYLALGDSYSSGEGDFSLETGTGNFMPHTDDSGPPRENCHLSKTSYPYLLRDIYGIEDSMMKSVACSGAMTTDVIANLSDYHGQNDRLIDVQDEDVYQATALERFIPGRIPQIEFVRTYKPRVITIGIGGNDAGFADRLAECVSDPYFECDAASGLNNQRERVGQAIMNNAAKLQNVYKALRDASPTSKIYAIGYPQFIQDSSAPCFLNGAFINASERHFIAEAVAQMNAVVEATAISEGIEYIDVADSLVGGRLCEGVAHDYVTGARNELYQAIAIEDLRTFLYHPNAAGHEKIAKVIADQMGDTIFGAKVASDLVTPEYSDYFDASEIYGTYVVSDKTIIKTVPTQGESITANFDESTYGYTTITVSMFSTPRILGTTLPSRDGSLAYTFTIPEDIEAGYHTLLFSGTSFSGDPMEIIQTIFVKSSNPEDIDGDGIPDVEDSCLFDAFCDSQNEGSSEGDEAPDLVVGGTVRKDVAHQNTEAWLDFSIDTNRLQQTVAVGAAPQHLERPLGALSDNDVLGVEYVNDESKSSSIEKNKSYAGYVYIVTIVGILIGTMMIGFHFAHKK